MINTQEQQKKAEDHRDFILEVMRELGEAKAKRKALGQKKRKCQSLAKTILRLAQTIEKAQTELDNIYWSEDLWSWRQSPHPEIEEALKKYEDC